jgi:hypothetical protein
MPKKAIIATDIGDAGDDLREAISRFLIGKGWSVWHRFTDLWLVANIPDETSPYDLWKELDAHLKGQSNILVFCLPVVDLPGRPSDAAGRVPGDAVDWLNRIWDSKPSILSEHSLPQSQQHLIT